MPYKFKPIVPKTPPPTPNIRAVVRELSNFGFEGQKNMSRYPSSQTAYRRTGRLGRGWTKVGPSQVSGALAVVIGTNVKYAPFVQGLKGKDPKQKKLFEKLGWLSVTTEGTRLWKKYRPRIQQALLGK